MAGTKTWDVLIDSGDTVSGRLMTERQARRVVAQMHTDATEYFPLTLVQYRSAADQTVVHMETFALEAEDEASAELMQGEPPADAGNR